MSFECTLQVSGIKPEVSHKAFLQSYITTSNPKYYKKYEKRLNDFFQKKLFFLTLKVMVYISKVIPNKH